MKAVLLQRQWDWSAILNCLPVSKRSLLERPNIQHRAWAFQNNFTQHSCHMRVTIITSFWLVNAIHVNIQVLITTNKPAFFAESSDIFNLMLTNVHQCPKQLHSKMTKYSAILSIHGHFNPHTASSAAYTTVLICPMTWTLAVCISNSWTRLCKRNDQNAWICSIWQEQTNCNLRLTYRY